MRIGGRWGSLEADPEYQEGVSAYQAKQPFRGMSTPNQKKGWLRAQIDATEKRSISKRLSRYGVEP